MDKFKNKYRIPSARLPHWDYGANAAYFVTICTAHRVCFFGDIQNHEMQLSPIGKIVETEWRKTFELRRDMNLEMDVFVVMPNHFHAIIIIGENEFNTNPENQRRDAMHGVSTNTINPENPRRDAMHGVSTGKPPQNKFGPQSKNLSSIIRGFKSAVTIAARQIDAEFAWQSRYYDHIIRDEKTYFNIHEYIINNPRQWDRDDYYNRREQ
ncbi:MAG: transposase [Calditrichaceae bacterium]